ncbi:hypothetical protein CRE_13680 [Caenorhabditis remanei]|uniref:Sdz-33 F-box domain-containing protein n=1 Tax=Caenorhabditis remanei TaxID=31234 RepID=E3N7I7_CAERE|nr:hypothetical protein CRE_13680 [Caenorhabditis remanei]
MSSAFPIFSLPFIPLKQVLDSFGSHAIINISLCSLRSKAVAISYRGPSKDVQLELGNYYLQRYEKMTICFLLNVKETSKMRKDRILDTVRIGDFRNVPVEMEMGGKVLTTYWDDRMIGLLEIANYAREIFNRDIYEINLGDEEDLGQAVEWIRSVQGSIKSLHCGFEPTNDSVLDYVLTNCKYTESLSLHVKPSDGYCPAKMPNFDIDELYLLPSFWIKQNHLLTMNCKYIVLQDSKLSNQDINVLVQHWMNGGCVKLKELLITVEVLIDYEEILEAVEFTAVTGDNLRDYVNHEDVLLSIGSSFDIKRSTDGTTATIDEDGVDSQWFHMVVWPDFVGNSCH